MIALSAFLVSNPKSKQMETLLEAKPNKKNRSARDERLLRMVQKAIDVYEIDNLSKWMEPDRTTFRRWRDGTCVPQIGNAMQIGRFMGLTDQSLHEYFDGYLTLEQLWERRGEAKRVTPSKPNQYDDILLSAKNLNFEGRYNLVMSLLQTLKTDRTQPAIPGKEPLTLPLQKKDQLRNWLITSLAYREMTKEDLQAEGINAEMTDDIFGAFTGDYYQEDYESLLPYLSEPIKWAGNKVVVDPDSPVTLEQLQDWLDEALD